MANLHGRAPALAVLTPADSVCGAPPGARSAMGDQLSNGGLGLRLACVLAVLFAVGDAARATPDFVEHNPLVPVYGAPQDVTMREPDAPREGEMIDVWARVGYSFYWDSAAVYYTTDGTPPPMRDPGATLPFSRRLADAEIAGSMSLPSVA